MMGEMQSASLFLTEKPFPSSIPQQKPQLHTYLKSASSWSEEHSLYVKIRLQTNALKPFASRIVNNSRGDDEDGDQ